MPRYTQFWGLTCQVSITGCSSSSCSLLSNLQFVLVVHGDYLVVKNVSDANSNRSSIKIRTVTKNRSPFLLFPYAKTELGFKIKALMRNVFRTWPARIAGCGKDYPLNLSRSDSSRLLIARWLIWKRVSRSLTLVTILTLSLNFTFQVLSYCQREKVKRLV